MKIVFLVSQWPIDGGIESVTRTLANEMVGRGHIVYVLYTSYYFPPSSGVFVDDRIILNFTYQYLILICNLIYIFLEV